MIEIQDGNEGPMCARFLIGTEGKPALAKVDARPTPLAGGFPIPNWEARANATLIKAAPDLFDALIAAKRMLAPLLASHGDGDFHTRSSLWKQMEAAIAKAGGW